MLKNKKILLIRLSALGDVVFNIPLANLLKKNGAKLYWLTSEKGYDVVKDNPTTMLLGQGIDKQIFEKFKSEIGDVPTERITARVIEDDFCEVVELYNDREMLPGTLLPYISQYPSAVLYIPELFDTELDVDEPIVRFKK